jgi:hypothetical protein
MKLQTLIAQHYRDHS